MCVQYIRGCSVHRGNIMMHVGVYEYIGGVQYVGVFSKWKVFINFAPPYESWYSPDVLMIFPDVLMVSSRCTEYPPAQCTEHPLMCWTHIMKGVNRESSFWLTWQTVLLHFQSSFVRKKLFLLFSSFEDHLIMQNLKFGKSKEVLMSRGVSARLHSKFTGAF